jgi:hypothetical protein
MLKDAIDTYLAVRRAAGFKLTDDAFYLYHFARFDVSTLFRTHG